MCLMEPIELPRTDARCCSIGWMMIHHPCLFTSLSIDSAWPTTTARTGTTAKLVLYYFGLQENAAVRAFLASPAPGLRAQ
jgi:hypothetical protein